MLAAARRRTVTLDELVDGLWPEGPQAQPRKTVQVYITRLRRTFGEEADAIRSEAAGYRLDTVALPTDAEQFEADLDSVTPVLEDGAAVALLRSALGRWRGDAFVDLRDCPAIVPVAVRLDELRLNAMQDLYEREIRRNPRGVISELEQAVEANPLHEGFAAQLMTAQYRAGRQADALATYQSLRRRLGEELGLDPGPAVRELEGRILRHELSVAAPAVAAAPERQRRRVTVLSLELSVDSAASLDPEEELLIVAPARQAARAQILHGGGVVLAEAGDGLTACFGYPARERSVEAAVRAALAIRDLAAGDSSSVNPGLRTRVGVDTGVVVLEAGNHSGGPSELMGIAGEPLRRATALRDDARPGDVLLGAETAAAVGSAIELEPGEGRARAVRVLAGGDGDLPGLIGRELEASELMALADGARHRVSMVVVTGTAGIGKSTLVASVLDGLGDEASVVRLRCDSRQSVTPLHPFRAALPELFQGDRDPSERSIVAALRARTGWLALVLDDVDAADPSTLDVLAALFDELPNGLVVMTSRTTEPLGIGDTIVDAVSLLPLARDAARRLAAEVAGERRLDLDTLNEIAERSGGVPLYIGALTRAALDTTNGHGSVRASVPATLYDSLMADLDRLGPARVSVQRCSVLGTSFDAADIELLGGSTEVVPAHLDAAVAQGVLVDEGAGALRFTHDLTASAAYGSLLNSERSELHARVAERFPPERARSEPEQLAFHVEAAGRPFEAAVAWRRASAKSIAANRHAEAQQLARRSIALLDAMESGTHPDGGDNLRRSLVNLAVALQATSHGSQELIHIIDRLHALRIESVDPPRAVVVGLIDVSNRQACGDFDGAERVAKATLELATTIDEGSATFARQFLGATRVWQGSLEGGGAELEQAAEFWEKADAPAAGASARAFGALWSLLGLAAHFQDRTDDATGLLDRARAKIPDDDGYGRCLVGGTRAMVQQLAGETDAVRDEVEPLWSLAMDLSSEFWLRWAQMLLGWALAAEPDSADKGLAMMAEVLDDTGATKQAVPYFAHLIALRLAEHGRYDEALTHVDDGLAVAETTGERLWIPLLHLVRARVLAGAGRRDESRSSSSMAAALAGDRGQHWVIRLCREHDEGRSRDRG